MQNIRITTVQTELQWEDKKSNLTHFESLISGLENKTDIILLPEMFTTGFTMQSTEMGEPMAGPALHWLKIMSNKLKAVLAGSVIIEDKGQHFNRLIWMQPDGIYTYYDKRHLFTHANEDKHFSPGTKILLNEWMGWRICPQICYDLRFPVWSRNTSDYDLLFYVANWPQARSHHWKSLLTARAIENQAYVIGVNRIGLDGMGLRYSGDTTVVDFTGQLLYTASDIESVHTLELSREDMYTYRNQYRFLPDQDRFHLDI